MGIISVFLFALRIAKRGSVRSIPTRAKPLGNGDRDNIFHIYVARKGKFRSVFVKQLDKSK
jgi:hypothetical protein